METSTTEKNKATVRSIFEQALNKRNTELLKELIDDGYKDARGRTGHEAYLAVIQPLFAAFPDIQWTIEDIVAEGNTVMLRLIWRGTHKGQFNKYAASGKAIINEGMSVYHLKNGKVTSSTAFPDRLSFFQQIGVVPADL